VVLATVFDLAWEPDEEGGEIRVGWHDLSRELSANKANLRIWLRRLVELGYLRTGWLAGREERMRIFTPTERAWAWATQNEPRVSAILRPSDQPSDEPWSPSDEDLPY
jgi:DNA-binding PadR family transcriptional regulator